MWLHFTDINMLAYGLGAPFVIQTVLLRRAWPKAQGLFGALGGWRARMGSILVLWR